MFAQADAPGSANTPIADSHAWVSRLEILILDRQHDYIKRILELQLEAALPEEDRCPHRAARSRAAARAALDEIRRHLATLHDTVGLPAQLARSVRGDVNVAVEIVKNLPAVTVSTSAGDCPICLGALTSAPEDTCASEEACEIDTTVVALPCGRGAHQFHRCCIQNWTKLSAKCPLCRQEITERSVRCLMATPRAADHALTPPVPSESSAIRSDVVEVEMSRLRSQSEGPPGRRLQGEVLQDSDMLLGTRRATLGDESSASRTRREATSGNSAAIMTAAATGYGRALASAAIASAQRCARRATPSTPNSSAASTAPSTPSHRRVRRERTSDDSRPGSSRDHNIAVADRANNVQEGSASDSEDLRLDVSDTASVVDTEIRSQGDILDRVLANSAASSRRNSPEGANPRINQSGSRPPLLQLGARGMSNVVHRSTSPPPPLRTDRSDRSSATGTSSPSSVGRSPSAAVIATAASGYGRALAAAAVASSLRLVAARPPALSEDGNLGNVPVNSRSFLHGSVAVGGHNVLARTGRDVLSRIPTARSRQSTETMTEHPDVENRS